MRGLTDVAVIAPNEAPEKNSVRITELRSVEGIEEFGAKLHVFGFGDLGSLEQSEIKVVLRRAGRNANSGIAESCADVVIANHRPNGEAYGIGRGRRAAQDAGRIEIIIEPARRRT